MMVSVVCLGVPDHGAVGDVEDVGSAAADQGAAGITDQVIGPSPTDQDVAEGRCLQDIVVQAAEQSVSAPP